MEVINIGRSYDNDRVIDDISVSKHHCQLIHHDNGTYEIVDISTYGTYVNGRKIKCKQILHHGDIVKIGNICLPWMTYWKQQYTKEKTPMNPTPHPNNNVPVYASPIVNIPNDININKREEYSNVAKKGDDFQVAFNRNLGDKMGDTIGSTLGCIISIVIIIAFIAIISFIMF